MKTKKSRFFLRIFILISFFFALIIGSNIAANFAYAGTINTNGLIFNYDHSSFTSGSSTVTNLVSGKPNAVLRKNLSTDTPTMGGTSSRNYFTTTAGTSDSTFRYNNSFLYTETATSEASFGDRNNVSAFAWVYPTTLNHVVLEERGSNYDVQNWYDTQIEMVNGYYKFRVWDCASIGSSSTTTQNAWHYVGFTYNYSTTTLTAYIDGNEVAKSTACTRQNPFANNYSLWYGVGSNAGTDLDGNPSARSYGGFRFGALHIYNRAISSSEISSNFSTKISQTITLSSLGSNSKTYPYSQALSMVTSGTSGSGAITYAISSGGTATGCSLSNASASATISATSTGTCLINATIAADTFYDTATSSSLTFTFSKATQTLTFATTSYSKSYLETQTVTATSVGTGAITYSSGSSTACSVSGATVTITAGTGTCTISASRAADVNYLEATAINDVTITVSARQLTAPGSITATAASTTSISISFSSVTGATSFTARVYDSAGTSRVGSDYANFTTGQSITGLSPSTTYKVTLLSIGDGTDNLSSSESAQYSVTTLSVALSPAITTHPVSTASTVGKSITLSIVANSPDTGTLSYQWRKDGNNISGATSDFLILNPLVIGDAGSYTCVVTNTTNGTTASLTSNTAIVVVNLALGIGGGSNIATTVGIARSSSAFTTSNGTGTKTYSLGETISGISVNVNTGVVTASSALSQAGSPYSIRVIATDEVGSSDSTTMTITVNPAITISSGVTGGVITKKYGASANSNAFSASNGTGSISLALSGLNSGLTISSGTVTAGTTLAVGSYFETVTATDSVGASATSTFRVDVTKADTVTVTAVSPSAVTYTGSPAAFSLSVSKSGLMNNDAISTVSWSYGSRPTCANGGTCIVGDRGPAGGIVFYVSNTVIDSATGISDGGIYLEAAPNTFSKTTYNWCDGFTNSNTTLIGGTVTTLGYGAENTRIISATCSGGAVKQAADLTFNGYSDWFLPSQAEQTQMYNQRAIIGMTGVEATYLYWGSSETANWHASSTVPWSGVGVQNKGQATPYWPIRAFSPTNTAVTYSGSAPTDAGNYLVLPSAASFSAGSADNYLAIVYETATATVSKASQASFSAYSNLSATFGQPFTIYPVGGSGDGYISYGVSNGSASGCALNGVTLTAAAAGTCSISLSKAESQNFLSTSSTFSVGFFVFVPVAETPAAATRATEIVLAAANAWSVNAAVAPTITSVSPTSGPVGTTITINGTGLSGVDTVKIGRKALTNIVGVSDNQITAVIPAGTSTGAVFVSNGKGSDFLASGFTVG